MILRISKTSLSLVLIWWNCGFHRSFITILSELFFDHFWSPFLARISSFPFLTKFPQIQGDVQWWGENTSGRCSQVFVIKVTRQPVWRVDFEIWKDVPNPSSCQHAYLTNGVVHGSPLTLDFELMMSRPPTASQERDITFSAANLAVIGTEVRRWVYVFFFSCVFAPLLFLPKSILCDVVNEFPFSYGRSYGLFV